MGLRRYIQMWWVIHHNYKVWKKSYGVDEKSLLHEIGLSANEAEAYLALLKFGASGAGKLAVKTGIHRRTVYDALEGLQKKGLAGAVEINGRQVFQAAEPKQLENFIDEKKDALSRALPGLQKYAKAEEETQITVMRGKAGLKSILRDVLDVRQTLYVFGGQMQIVEELGSYFEFFTKKLEQLGIKQKMVLLDLEEVRKKAKELPLLEAKYIDPSEPSSVVWWLYGNRIAIIVWKSEPEVIRIVSSEYVKAFKKSFDLAWQEESRTYHGLEGVKAVLEDTLNYKETIFIGANGQAVARLPDYIKNSYTPRAMKIGHVWRGVAKRMILDTPAPKVPFFQIRLFPKNVKPSPNVIWIWGDNVANIVWLEKPVVFLVKNKVVAKSYREYFQFLWKDAEKIK